MNITSLPSRNAFIAFVLLFWTCLSVPFSVSASEGVVDTNPISKLTPISVQVNWKHQYQFAGFYAAVKQGYYQQAGLDVTIKAWHPKVNVVDEVISGRADFAVGYSSVVADYAKGAPISLVMVSFQFSPMILLTHEPIYDLKQLAGKTVMQNGNLQINSLIDKANALVDKKVVKMPTSGDLNDFINHNVDLYSAFETNEPYRLYQQGVPFYTLDPKSFGIQSYEDLVFTHKDKVRSSPGQVKAFKQATIKGWEYAIRNQTEMVDYILEHYPVKKSRKALLSEAKATTMFVQTGTNKLCQVDVSKLVGIAVQAKESGLITQMQLDSIDLRTFLFNPQTLSLTQQERDYLQAHPVIKVANDINWAPFEFVNEAGGWEGMAADFFAIFEKQLGVKFEHNQSLSWPQMIETARSDEFSLLSSVVKTEERQKYLNFTAPYLSFPMVLATSSDAPFIDDLIQLKGKTLAVGRGYWSHSLFKSLSPTIKLEVVDSVQAGLEAVLSGRAYAYAGNIAAISYVIKNQGFTNLHIAGKLGEPFDLAIGVQKNNPILFSILNKSLASVTDEQRNEIYSRWIRLDVLSRTDHSVWIKTVLIAVAVFIVLLIILVLMQLKKRSQAAYIQQINELSFATYTHFQTRKFEWVSDSFAKLTGYSKEELLEQSLDLLRHPSVDPQVYEAVWQGLQSGKAWRGELCARAKSGREYWVDVVMTPDYAKGKVKGFWTTRVDITDKKILEELAIRDSLTGVFNRHHFNKIFEARWNQAILESKAFAMAIIDIDFFKEINDYYGHQKGDEILKQVVDCILQYTQQAGEPVFRLGGEEFVVFSHLQEHADFFKHLERLREVIEGVRISNPKTEFKTLTASIGGVFCSNPDSKSLGRLYRLADKALYEAKHQGRNQVVMHVI